MSAVMEERDFLPEVLERAQGVFDYLENLSLDEKVSALNVLRSELHQYSPFKDEPVDCIQWVKSDDVGANDYNPNSVAPPEMKLLETSIMHDGYTQPIVSWPVEKGYEVIDGFHRNRVCKESPEVNKRVHGYLPITIVREERTNRNDRIASTIRHNRARGKHKVDSMSDIVVELKRRNWTNTRISRELGMDQDEILRLCQVTGLADLFDNQEFSKSWDVEGEVDETDFQELTDDVETYGEEKESFRVVNTSDEDRIFHTWDKWECYKAGFYKTTKDGMSKDECQQAYCDFLADTDRFSKALEIVTTEWKYSCEHYLTNAAMNRVAWLGQAAMCQATGVPSVFRGGFFLLTEEQQEKANNVALEYLNKWLIANDREPTTMEAVGVTRQSDIY